MWVVSGVTNDELVTAVSIPAGWLHVGWWVDTPATAKDELETAVSLPAGWLYASGGWIRLPRLTMNWKGPCS